MISTIGTFITIIYLFAMLVVVFPIVLLILVVFAIGSEETSTDHTSNIDYNDEDMYCCTGAWRNLHKFGYRWTAEEDEANGW